jgi:hypothetical protein
MDLAASPPSPKSPHVKETFRVYLWLRKHGWTFELEEFLNSDSFRSEVGWHGKLQEMADVGIIIGVPRVVDPSGNRLMLNPEHPVVKVVRLLVEWVPEFIRDNLRRNGWRGVDTVNIISEMRKQRVFNRLRIGNRLWDVEEWLVWLNRFGLIRRTSRRTPEGKKMTCWRA